MLCDYGCGQKAVYTLKNNKKCCESFYTKCPELRKKNSNGLKKAHKNNPNMYRFTECARENSNFLAKQTAAQKLIDGTYVGTNDSVKKILFGWFKLEPICNNCGIEEWNGIKIPLELDHIDGDSTNNSIKNLRLLCPNCHSVTPNWRGKNINNGKTKVSDEQLLTSLKKHNSIRKGLIEVGLAAKGGNYTRAKKLLSRSGGIGDTR